MANTPQSQLVWYNKIRSFIPNWFFEEEDNQEAHIQGLAKLFSELDKEITDHVDETFISKAEGDFLEQHGAERSVDKLTGEFDAQYSERIRNIKNESNCPDLKSQVDAILMIGESEIVEDYNSTIFVGDESFVNRGSIVLEEIVNVFSILVEKQLHEPYSFVGREYFAERDEFVGTALSSEYVFKLLQEAVNTNKGLGTLYRVIEKIGA